MSEPTFRYIVVEGPIGVGKTTLTHRLARSFDAEILLEAPQDNPFLERFYADPDTYALSTQLSFLMQRVEQLRGLAQPDLFTSVRVADFMLEKDRIFAGLTLENDELDLYLRLYEQMVTASPCPDLVIYLQAPVDVLQERIALRGIDYEQGIDRDYLERLAAAYTRFFFHYEAAPLVIVNAAEINLASGEEDYQTLLRQLLTIRRGRHYLNPLPF
jgi:deoxyadenosine/deoxycytidine kinase